MFLVKVLCFTLILLVNFGTFCECQQSGRNFLAHMQNGFKWAGKMLGLEESGSVADLVSQAFKTTSFNRKSDHDQGNIFASLLRILGFDAKRIGAVAVNTILFMAQLINSSFVNPFSPRLTYSRNSSPFVWMLQKIEGQNLISHLKSPNLADRVIEEIKERSLDEQTDCVQLLVCKISPFVWSMQSALDRKEETVDGGKHFLYRYLPSLEDTVKKGDECEKIHPHCYFDI